MDVTIIAGIMGVIGGLVGVLIGGLFTIWAAKKQYETSVLQIGGEIHERLYNQNHLLLEIIATYPELRPYFEENLEFENCDPTTKNRILMIAEMHVSFFELIVIQLPNLPSSIQKGWKNFILDMYKNSPAIRSYTEQYKEWFIDGLHSLIKEVSNHQEIEEASKTKKQKPQKTISSKSKSNIELK